MDKQLENRIRIGRNTETRQCEASRGKEELEMVKVCQVTSFRLVCSTGLAVQISFPLIAFNSSTSEPLLSNVHSIYFQHNSLNSLISPPVLPSLAFPSPSSSICFIFPSLFVPSRLSSGLRGARQSSPQSYWFHS